MYFEYQEELADITNNKYIFNERFLEMFYDNVDEAMQ